MPPQHVEIAETIAALKRALRREKEAPSNQIISSATNRGNKLKRGANFVHAGSMPWRTSSLGQKEKIEHAGYTRYILHRNPKKYDEYGDELEESEADLYNGDVDLDADPDADDENPYGDVKIEEILRPLRDASELWRHSAMSVPYLDSALPDTVHNTEAQLRQERANLWRAKNLYRSFVGDESWMPCGKVEAETDWDLFDPLAETGQPVSSKKRKRNNEIEMADSGVNGQDHARDADSDARNPPSLVVTNGEAHANPLQQETPRGLEVDTHAVENIVIVEQQDVKDKNQEDTTMLDGEDPTENGIMQETDRSEPQDTTQAEMQQQNSGEGKIDSKAENDKPHEAADRGREGDAEESEATEENTPPRTRRITRALAASNDSTNNTSADRLTPKSPALTSSSISGISRTLLEPAPLFLLPAQLSLSHSKHPSSLPLHVAHSGLPPDEILETRRLLGMYIQKQEETIRGLEGVLSKLINAKRMRDKVWAWSKASGHEEEWSDGEDWIDCEAWGIQPDELRKGKDEDEANVEEETTVGGRKGKRRRGGRD